MAGGAQHPDDWRHAHHRWAFAVPGLVCGLVVAGVVISRAPGRPFFWVVGAVGFAVCAAIGVALALGWRPTRARPPLGVPSVWDRDRAHGGRPVHGRSDRWSDPSAGSGDDRRN